MILTKHQADVIRLMLTNDKLVLGRKKNIGSCIIFNVDTGIAMLGTKKGRQVPLAVHGRIINDMLQRGLLIKSDDNNHRLTAVARAINPVDLVDFTAEGKTRVTEDGIRGMADKYGYGFEFQRVVGIALFTKDAVIVAETCINIERLSDKSLTEWEAHLSDYIKGI